MAISSWNPDWFSLPGQAMFDRARQQVTAISRASGNLDLFVIGADNRVWSTFWSDAGGWRGDWFPLPGDAVFNRDTQQVAAVSRAPGNLDLFVIGFDNRVWSTFWTDLLGWHGDWFPLPGKAVFEQVQRIAAVSRTHNHLDLFALGADNRCWSIFWSTAHGWDRDWFPLPGHAVFDHHTQRIAAVARAPGNLDLFAIGFDNHAWATFWTDANGWHGDWFPLPGRTQFDHKRQHLAVVARTPGNLDLFAVGFDDRAWSMFWTAARGWHGDWFPLPGGALFDHDKQQITAVARTPGNLDLFVSGPGRRVWTTFWNGAGGWHHEWFPLPGQAVVGHDTQPPAVLARTQSNLDVFAIGPSDRVWSTCWSRHDAHPAIRLRAVAAQGRFVEVVGHGFTPHQSVRLGYDIVADGAPAHQSGEDTLICDGAGGFVDRIAVSLAGAVTGAQAEATDLASNATVTASI